MNEPTAIPPKYPRSWMQPFLDRYAKSGHVAESATALNVCTSNVWHQVKYHPGFAKAFASAQAKVAKRLAREHRQRTREAGLPDDALPQPPRPMHPAIARLLRNQERANQPVSAADFCHFVGNSHAGSTVVRAELDTLSLLIAKVAEAAGVDELDGLSVVAWYMAEHPKMLEHHLLDIGDTDPGLAEHLERHLAPFRSQAGPTSMLHPPQD